MSWYPFMLGRRRRNLALTDCDAVDLASIDVGLIFEPAPTGLAI